MVEFAISRKSVLVRLPSFTNKEIASWIVIHMRLSPLKYFSLFFYRFHVINKSWSIFGFVADSPTSPSGLANVSDFVFRFVSNLLLFILFVAIRVICDFFLNADVTITSAILFMISASSIGAYYNFVFQLWFKKKNSAQIVSDARRKSVLI